MQYYKSRQDDQLLEEAYDNMIEEKLRRVAASLGAAAALASGGCDGPNCKPESASKKMHPLAPQEARAWAQQNQERMEEMREVRYKGEVARMFGGSVNFQDNIPVRNGRVLLSLEKLNTLRQKYKLRPIDKDSYMRAGR